MYLAESTTSAPLPTEMPVVVPQFLNMLTAHRKSFLSSDEYSLKKSHFIFMKLVRGFRNTGTER